MRPAASVPLQEVQVMRLNSRLALIGAVSALALAISPSAALAHEGGHGHGHNAIKANFIPSRGDGPMIGVFNPVGKPWILANGKVRVRENGRMDVRLRGLQIPELAGPGTPNVNPIGFINAVLLCGGVVAADSGQQPLSTPDGDARFRVMLAGVPKHCDMATVLISVPTAPTPTYIASAMAMDDE